MPYTLKRIRTHLRKYFSNISLKGNPLTYNLIVHALDVHADYDSNHVKKKGYPRFTTKLECHIGKRNDQQIQATV